MKYLRKSWICLILIFLIGVVIPTKTEAAEASTLRIVNATYPTVLKQGQSFTVGGIVKCNYAIKEVAFVIRSTDLSKVYYKTRILNPQNPYTVGAAVDNAMKFNALPIGKYRYMIYAKDASGTSKFILDKTFSVTATGGSTSSSPSTLRIVGPTYPTTLKVGSSFNLEGIVKCNYAIKQVAFVIRSSDKSQLYYKTVVNNPRNPYTVTAAVNNAMKFSSLKTGNYRYMVYAKDASGTSKYILDKPFSVTTTGLPSNSGDSTLRIVSPTYPVSLEKGQGFNVAGTVKSNYTLKEVAFAIRSENLDVLYDKIVIKNPRNPYIVGSVVDNALEFDKLGEGTYRYIIHGKDASGASKNLLDKKFTVEKGASTLKITNPHYPISVLQGTEFNLEGTISSNYNVISLAFTILDRSTDMTVRKKNIFQNDTTYTIGEEVNSAMDIAGLPTGSYKYVVAAKDESGLRLTLVNRNFEVVASQDSEVAIWPLSQVYITQGAYDSYSHQTENAFDCVVQPITGAKAFAPFDGRVVAAEPTWGTIWFQSDNKVRYADGTYDYMTAIFMHGQNSTSLLGQSFRQGEAFYLLGGTGPSGPNTYDKHLHVEIYKGKVSPGGAIISANTAWSYRGNVYPNKALYVDKTKTTILNNYGYSFKTIS